MDDRLNDKLKDAVYSQLGDKGGEMEQPMEPIQTDEQMLQNMQYQIDTALQVKFFSRSWRGGLSFFFSSQSHRINPVPHNTKF